MGGQKSLNFDNFLTFSVFFYFCNAIVCFYGTTKPKRKNPFNHVQNTIEWAFVSYTLNGK